MAFPEKLTDEQIAKYFPLETRLPDDGVFEIGLVLGGTVSAGAYTGGVLDFLVEALDAWYRAKQVEDPEAPPHRVVITTVGGASGGAINGAILARAAGIEFDHGSSPENPFFDAWTQRVDLMNLLKLDGRTEFDSLLNTEALKTQVDRTLTQMKGRPLGTGTSPGKRSYFASPLSLFMMVGNVTGVPYRIPMSGDGDLAHNLVSHADYMRFALLAPGHKLEARPDELPISHDSTKHWDIVGRAALATSAFPLAFPSRSLERVLEATNCRAIAVPDRDGKMKAQQLIPDWESLPLWKDDQRFSSFANVDGGTFNNEPLDVVRLAMAGLNGTNRRSPSEAKRAVILIDPFSDAEKLGTPDTSRLTSMIGPILSALIQQPRFKPADLALAYNEGTYSRFLISPTRQGVGRKYIGKDAIASGALGGFFGFLDCKLLVHDYLLGRVNAHSFLRRHFMLPESADNPLFRDPWWTEPRRQKYGVRDADGKRFLPIIPLMGDLRDRRLETAPWPSSLQMPAGFEAAVEARLDALYAKLKAQLAPSNWLMKMAMDAYLGSGWRIYGRRALRDIIVGKFKDGLADLRKHP